MTTKLQWAQHWAGLGFCVFPVYPNSKHPAIEKWQEKATCDPAVIAEWWAQRPDANIGAHPGASGHCVIDVDVKAGARGPETLAELSSVLGALPPTMTMRTASSGLHLWFAGVGPSTIGRLGEGIDTRGDRGFVVMPGSSIDGAEYVIDVDLDPAPLPEAWSARLAEVKAHHGERPAATTETDTPEQIDYARRHVARLIRDEDVAVEGAGGNGRTFRLAAELADFGLTLETALEVAAPWNEACSPPWEEDEFAAVFANAYRYRQNEVGAKASAAGDGSAFAAISVPEPEEQPEAPKSRFRSWFPREFAAIPPPSWLLDGFIPARGVSVVFGTPGAGKSFLSVDLACAVAAGGTAWGVDKPLRKAPVAYFAAEGHTGIARQRVPAWSEARGLDPSGLLLLDASPRASERALDLEDAFAHIEARFPDEKPRLVVIDTHARAMVGLDENAAQDTGLALEMYDAIVRRYSCAVLVLHHANKGGAERGSTALAAGVDAVFRLEKDEDAGNGRRVLTCSKMKDGEEPRRTAFQGVRAGPSIVFERARGPAGDWIAPAPSALFAEVYKILLDAGAHSVGTGLEPAALAASLECVALEPDEASKENARRRMARVLKAGAREGGDLSALSDGAVFFIGF